MPPSSAPEQAADPAATDRVAADRVAADRVLVAFAHALRDAGLQIGTNEVIDFCRGVTHVDVASVRDVYHTGRALLVHRQPDLAVYDAVFRRTFHVLDADADVAPREVEAETRALAPAEQTGEDPDGEAAHELAGASGSDLELLRTKRFDACSPDELARIGRLLARLDLTPPPRVGRRSAPSDPSGRMDLRRTVRRSLRHQGELTERAWQDRRPRPRPLVFLLDISGSMAAYSRALLQLAWLGTSREGSRGRVEVFCFATRLTRITSSLRRSRLDTALAAAAAHVEDWGGGTRIGEALQRFLRGWGRDGMARGAVVVICSDGLDCGDPSVVGRQMELLARLAHRVVWVNPLKADPRYEPLARGMAAALPHVDEFVTGHDLASLETLADLIARAR